MIYLCLNCRHAGHQTLECPSRPSLNTRQDTGSHTGEPAGEILLRKFATNHDDLCSRCNSISILSWFEKDIKDELDETADPMHTRVSGTTFVYNRLHTAGSKNSEANSKERFYLGSFAAITLTAECPLCRLIFRVFPTRIEGDLWDTNSTLADFYLVPILSHNARRGDVASTSETDKYAIYVFVANAYLDRHAGLTASEGATLMEKTERCFGLSYEDSDRRKELALYQRSEMIDVAQVKMWLEECGAKHLCRQAWRAQLLDCKMIDVRNRKIVPCPVNCKYVTLSYVWGNVTPEPGALSAGNLPATIEDAIALTCGLGIDFLWVDALCIDQAESHEKTKQLNMMDIIYSSAVVTLVAQASDDGNAGIPGVGNKQPRQPQGIEYIHGKKLLCNFPSHTIDLRATKYFTRAWTVQEEVLSPAKLYLGRHQATWSCLESKTETMHISSTKELSLDPDHVTNSDLPEKAMALPITYGGEHTRYAVNNMDHFGHLFQYLLEQYTDRQMTNSGDSLNACLGLLAALRRSWQIEEFVWGLPLKEFPHSLRWQHAVKTVIERRPNFPSWSYVGWKGKVSFQPALGSISSGQEAESTDLRIEYVRHHDHILTLKGHLLLLDIRNSPFHEAYMPDTEFFLGILQEGNLQPHQSKLLAGRYEVVLVERRRPNLESRDILHLLLTRRLPNGLLERETLVILRVGEQVRTSKEYLGLFTSPRTIDMQ